MDFGEYQTPEEWDASESLIFDATFGAIPGAVQDDELQDLFDAALFDPDISREDRALAYGELLDYLDEYYGVEFEDIFDWEDYQDWYEGG